MMELSCYDDNDNPTYGYDGKMRVCPDGQHADKHSICSAIRKDIILITCLSPFKYHESYAPSYCHLITE